MAKKWPFVLMGALGLCAVMSLVYVVAGELTHMAIGGRPSPTTVASRRMVKPRSLLMVGGGQLPRRSGQPWTVRKAGYVVPGSQIVSEVGTQWDGAQHARLMQKVIPFSTGTQAAYYFRRQDPKDIFSSDFPGQVKTVPRAAYSIGADESEIVCGNAGKSSDGELSDCGMWALWARYGQYVISVGVSTGDGPMNRDEFLAYVPVFDDFVNEQLS